MSELDSKNLMLDVRTVLNDVEELLRLSASTTGARASGLRETAMNQLKQARDRASDMQGVVVGKSTQAMRDTNDYVIGHPWTAIGVAAAVGAFLGLLLVRR
jgi:ElaB/YqjD/DUF883 family membrane-anchored ribosome-binding protein